MPTAAMAASTRVLANWLVMMLLPRNRSCPAGPAGYSRDVEGKFPQRRWSFVGCDGRWFWIHRLAHPLTSGCILVSACGKLNRRTTNCPIDGANACCRRWKARFARNLPSVADERSARRPLAIPFRKDIGPHALMRAARRMLPWGTRKPGSLARPRTAQSRESWRRLRGHARDPLAEHVDAHRRECRLRRVGDDRELR